MQLNKSQSLSFTAVYFVHCKTKVAVFPPGNEKKINNLKLAEWKHEIKACIMHKLPPLMSQVFQSIIYDAP